MAIKSKGTNLQLEISSVYTTIASVRSLKAPKAKVGFFDATALDSGVGGAMNVTGYVKTDPLTGSLWFTPTATTHKALTARVTTPSHADNWKVIFNDGSSTTWSFAGGVSEFGPVSVEQDQGLSADFAVQPDGLITYPS